jgi:hypothetical protein
MAFAAAVEVVNVLASRKRRRGGEKAHAKRPPRKT